MIFWDLWCRKVLKNSGNLLVSLSGNLVNTSMTHNLTTPKFERVSDRGQLTADLFCTGRRGYNFGWYLVDWCGRRRQKPAEKVQWLWVPAWCQIWRQDVLRTGHGWTRAAAATTAWLASTATISKLCHLHPSTSYSIYSRHNGSSFIYFCRDFLDSSKFTVMSNSRSSEILPWFRAVKIIMMLNR